MNHEPAVRSIFFALLFFSFLHFLFLPQPATAEAFVIEDQSSCEARGGTWNALGICVVNTLKVGAGDKLEIEESIWLRVDVTLEIEGILQNGGLIDLVGDLQVDNGGRLVNENLLALRPSATLVNNGLITNSHQISNGGSIDNIQGTIDNNCQGILYGSGSLIGNAPIREPGSFICSGKIVFLPRIVR